jgi:Na+-transporting NADH:ubiquinone oxidoreductase subunit B
MNLIWTVALLPTLFGKFSADPITSAISFGIIAATIYGIKLVFSRVSGSAIGLDGFLTAGLMLVLLPPDIEPWRVILATSFGIVIGEQICGGRGWSFVNPVVVSLSFLYFSFADTAQQPVVIEQYSGLFAILILAGCGLIPHRFLIAALSTIALMVLAMGGQPTGAMSGLLFVTLAFLGCDPAASSVTNPGRWITGILVGLLVVVLTPDISAFDAPKPMIFAILLTAIFAPLIDASAIAVNHRHRSLRRAK